MLESLSKIWDYVSSILNANIIDSEESETIEISLFDIIKLIIALVVVVFLTRLLKRFLKNKILSRFGIDESNREALATLISYFIAALSFIISLRITGFQLEGLAVIAGGLSIGIGIGLQNIVSSFVSGLTLLFERTVKVGDFVEFDGLSGYVKSVSLRSTIIRTREGGDVVVPNSHLVENKVLNWSYDTFIARIDIPVGVSYSSDPVLVTEILFNSAYMEPSVISNPPTQVLFRGFGDNSLDFELRVWVNRIDREPVIRSSLNFIIEYNLRQQGVEIPFPQRDLWLRNPELLPGNREFLDVSQKEDHLVKAKIPQKPLALKDLLRRVTYFQNFTDLELRQLIEIGQRKRLREDAILFREGDSGDAFYIILSGGVKVYVEKIDKHLTNLKAGDFFGELALMLGIPRTASVKALEDTILFMINNSSFRKLLQEHPDLSEVIIQELAKHQHELTERQKELRKLGLVDAQEDDRNPVKWVRKRLQKLFHLE